MKKIFLPIFLLLIFLFAGCGGSQATENNSDTEKSSVAENTSEKVSAEKKSTATKKVTGDLKITMLNVGQGDAFLIQTKSQNILIDTSDRDEVPKLVNELKKAFDGKEISFDKVLKSMQCRCHKLL